MNKKSLTSTEPVYVGFVGPAGSGKTFTAKSIVPSVSAAFYGDPSLYPNVRWEHRWMSSPLYGIYAARTETIGEDKQSRIMHAIHDIVTSVMRNGIDFEEMLELIYDLYALPITNQPDEKPRTFLQQAGDLFLKQDQLCLVRYSKSKIYSAWMDACSEYDRYDLEAPWYVGIISDVRQVHEAKLIHDSKNSLLIKFEADPTIIQGRLLDRDGILLSETEASHRTEQGFDLIPNEWYDLVIDTTEMSKKEQVEQVKQFILSHNSYTLEESIF